jgi:hypothetical protein
MMQDPLTGLRDYHLPEAVSWWPPAPGWWFLAALALLIVAGLSWLRSQRRRRHHASRLAFRELAQLRAAWQVDADGLALLRGLSQLTRRFCLARFPADRPGGLYGDAWLTYLAAKSAEPAFVDGVGRRLAEAPYWPERRGAAAPDRHTGLQADAPAIADLIERLIARNTGEPKERES